ncbi:hypothetical protein [Flavisolibacter tropicus]|uniref:Uncharacterized protein n=1 Tax=Flavisolibacter tropicus TaxID=1492898 RepID=A0A172TXN8_9BACT|nr:hypothetical protein [Flavisolibacter tropicus]ANE51738.1 hypothetical protein SY85_15785 [Flavisolibacter tropicus]
MRQVIAFVLFSSVAYGQNGLEVIDFKTAKLNKTIPSALTTKQLKTLLGKPTKIEDYTSECALTEEQERAKVKQLYSFGHTQFFVFDHKAELTSIDFRSGTFSYLTEKILLTSTTTLADLQKVYPKSVSAAIKENGGKLVRLKPCKDCDGQCLLYFEKGKLVQLNWWEEC